MIVPTTGMKFSGRYRKYRMIALGVDLANGFFTSFPRRAILSPPVLICRPSLTRLVHSLLKRVPSNVSVSASSMKNVLDKRFTSVELSLRVSKAAEMAAKASDVASKSEYDGSDADASWRDKTRVSRP